MNELERLKELLERRSILPDETFEIDDIDSLLDSRDIPEFDNEWIRNYNEINKSNYKFDTNIIQIIDIIREFVYKTVYNATENGELSAYVSDDFDIISRALVIGYKDKWLNSLVSKYKENTIPSGLLCAVDGNLEELLLEK